ncbi:MAG: ABC transporter permease [Proteobacteria bacterium]|nr:ABC transporter permease [Pseudomonadota bacterium]
MDLFLATLRSLRAHALRFFLTSLGIVWGAFMLTMLAGFMEGTDRHYMRELSEVGPKRVWLFPGFVMKPGVGERGARSVFVENDDVDGLQRLESVERLSPNIPMWAAIVRGERRTKLLTVWGVNADAHRVSNTHIAEGRPLSPTDVERSARVAVLGPTAAVRLFGRTPAPGHTIHVNSVPFRVVGVTVAKKEQIVNLGGRDDESIWIPYTAAQRWLVHDDRVAQAIFEPPRREQTYGAIQAVRQIMGLRHDYDPGIETALNFVNMHEILRIVESVLLGLKIFLFGAGMVTLLVGAIGVMNIMLVVVGERRTEIGLRKAVGATGGAIFLQFLAEAVAVSSLSALVGSGLGLGLVAWLRHVVPPESPLASSPVADPGTVALITAVLALVGITSGLLPALRASRVPPAESLRAL